MKVFVKWSLGDTYPSDTKDNRKTNPRDKVIGPGKEFLSSELKECR